MSKQASSFSGAAEIQGSRIEEINEDAGNAGLEELRVEPKPAAPRRAGRRIPFLPNAPSGRRRGANYVDQYPADEVGGEMGENARVWRVYLDEAEEYDAEMMESFRDTTDVLLVFAGLFSAVVTTFVSQASQALEPDYGLVTAALMTELVSLQRAIASGTPISDIPRSPVSFSDADTTTAFDLWVNGLWFTSLTLSLVTALIAVLVKQWLQYYISALSGTPRDRVLVRHYRFLAVERWRVAGIIGALPVLLHLALFMFLAGLVIFVWALNLPMATIILSVTTVGLIFYVLSNLLASHFPDCPYKTPVADFLLYFSQLWHWLSTISIRHLSTGFVPYPRTNFMPIHLPGLHLVLKISAKEEYIKSRRMCELEATHCCTDNTLIQSLVWLTTTSSNPSAGTVASNAFGGIPFHLDPQLLSGLPFEIMAAHSYHMANDFFQNAPIEQKETALLAFTVIRVPLVFHFQYDSLFSLSSPSPIIRCLSTLARPDLNRLNVMIDLIANEASLPPWLWKSLFEDHVASISHPTTLLMLLLDVIGKPLGRAPQYAVAIGTNWNLPPLITLAELCYLDRRMIRSIVQFACRFLLQGIHADVLRANLETSDVNSHYSLLPAIVDFDPAESILFAHAVLEQLETRINVSPNIQEGIAAVERYLLSMQTTSWTITVFVDAFFHCITLFQSAGSSPLQPRLYHRSPVPRGLGLVMLYILDVLQHPWPLLRRSDVEHEASFGDLLLGVFSAQNAPFTTFLENDGMSTFRSRIPIDFRRSLGGYGYWHFFHCLVRAQLFYVDFVIKLPQSDARRQAHLDAITQPDNLAWLLWLSSEADPPYHLVAHEQHEVKIQLTDLLPRLPVNQERWKVAVNTLVEELRRECALRGPVPDMYRYPYTVLDELGLAEDRILYGYASVAVLVGDDSDDPCFQRVVVENEDPVHPTYGPFPVAYDPTKKSIPGETQAGRWYQLINNAFKHIVSIKTDKDAEGLPI